MEICPHCIMNILFGGGFLTMIFMSLKHKCSSCFIGLHKWSNMAVPKSKVGDKEYYQCKCCNKQKSITKE